MPAEWLTQLPEDIRGEPSLAQISGKDWAEAGPVLAKNYVNAQKLVGADKIQAPQASWADKDWEMFFSKVGRPETSDRYTLPTDIKLEGDAVFDEKKLATARSTFHKLGLSDRQASGIIRYYVESLNSSSVEQRTREESSVAEASNKLRTEFGDKFDQNVDLAKGVIRKFGAPELVEFLNTSRLGDNPHLIRMLTKIGQGMSEDDARGQGPGLFVKDATAAKAEVDRLSGDKEFQEALNSREHPGHRAALERWTHTFTKAYPGKEPGE